MPRNLFNISPGQTSEKKLVFMCTTSTCFHVQVRTMKTRHSENDNTPQPLDQWMDSPYMGQQDRNCKSFTSTHYMANVFAMHCGPRASPLCIQQSIQLTSLSLQVNQLSHSQNMAIKNFTLKIQGQDHGWGQRLKSQLGSNILSTHILLVSCQSTPLFLW